jgi:ATP-dependent Zn protease
VIRRRKQDSTDGPATEGLVAPGQIGSRLKEAERRTRKPLDLWDRAKVLLMLCGIYGVLWVQAIGVNPIKPVLDSFYDTADRYWWVLLLIAVEIVRQGHFLVAEHWSGYYLFWKRGVFGRIERLTGRIDPWLRYRVSRALRWAFWIAAFAIVLGNIWDEAPIEALVSLPGRVWDFLPFILQLAFGFLFVAVQFFAIFFLLSRGGTETYFPEDIDTRFSDVWGQDHVVERVKENLIFLENPESIERRGGYTPGGILLWGPPGTGKTLMAEAAAGETGKPFVFVEPGAFINMFFGIGIVKVKLLYRKLRKLALRYGGVVVFFDEVDSLGNRGIAAAGGTGPFRSAEREPGYFDDVRWLSERSAQLVAEQRFGTAEPLGERRDGLIMGAGMGGGGMGTLQSILTEMSGLKKPRGFFNRRVRKLLGMRPKPPPTYRILHMMATNLPDVLDPALLRPGRLDRIYRVGYPSKAGRIRTFQGYLDKVNHSLSPEEVEKLATISPYATGAVIKDVVNEALIMAIRDGRETITWNDIIRAKRLKRLGPPEDVEYIERERHAVAIHEACHAVAAATTRKHLTIDIATIEKGGGYLGMVSSIDPEDRYTQWRSEYEADLIVSLASLAGERLFFAGDNSSGVAGDLESATAIAAQMIGFWGMGESVTSHLVRTRLQLGGGGQPDPKPGAQESEQRLRMGLGDQIERKLVQMLRRAETLLSRHRHEVFAVAHALETYKTISGDDIVAILNGTQGPVVDGRLYRLPDVQRALEAYHEEAAAAHRENRPSDVELPDLAGYVVEVELAEEHDEHDPAAEPASVDEAALAGVAFNENDTASP